jgi:WD40 repeat protein
VKGKTGAFGKNCNILCCVEVEGDKIYTGASDGSILVWGGNSCMKGQKAHTGAINAICLHKGIVLTGSNDKTVKLFKSGSLEPISIIDCNKILDSSVNASIRSIDVW